MMLSKLNQGAMGAAGNGVPDKADQQARPESTRGQAAGASDRFLRSDDGLITAGIMRAVPVSRPGADAARCRLLMVCNSSNGGGEMQLTWSPEPPTGVTMTAPGDGGSSVDYKIEGKESIGRGRYVSILRVGSEGHAELLECF